MLNYFTGDDVLCEVEMITRLGEKLRKVLQKNTFDTRNRVCGPYAR